MSILQLHLADREGLRWAQDRVTRFHYLHRPVDVRCSLLAYLILLDGERVGCLIFGRPEAQCCGGWYGSVEDVQTGKCRITRWQVLNLARVWLDPLVQAGGDRCEIGQLLVPGFRDRKRTWRTQLASTIISMALLQVGIDYLEKYPPVFLDEPYEIVECLSYCDTRIHQGLLYRAAGFSLVRENACGIQTYARPLRPLYDFEHLSIRRLASTSLRSRRYRAARAVAMWQQAALFEPTLAQGGKR
jgi:hypothetical protein